MTTANSLIATLADLRHRALERLALTTTADLLEEWRIAFIARKGELPGLREQLPSVPREDMPGVGKAFNAAKQALEQAYEARKEALGGAALEAGLAAEAIDITLPGRAPLTGYAHPVRETLREIIRIFGSMGFSVAEGPEAETDRNNFELLNIPADHPSRDTMDTFYLDVPGGILLRTHTSPVQARVMLSQDPPIRIIAPGRCFRRDQEDASHLSYFWQCEGLAVDRDITFSDLKGVLANFANQILGCNVRFRPHHFQFTEPSAEFDFSCLVCGGKGCRVCKYEGWLEISGAGMVHPQVLRNVGYDPEVYSGFAFGMGPERITMMRYGINDIRLLNANDLRFLRQFA
ncbi:MAG TPA: phenylalanine--tRNA ligase subunit alpha [Chloroflexota bacterium]|nr:phenylalanine--tRNA ligase subunit alpha [Chloroflexota bacterium]